MRMRDWSSDVCSSDLAGPERPQLAAPGRERLELPPYPGLSPGRQYVCNQCRRLAAGRRGRHGSRTGDVDRLIFELAAALFGQPGTETAGLKSAERRGGKAGRGKVECWCVRSYV